MYKTIQGAIFNFCLQASQLAYQLQYVFCFLFEKWAVDTDNVQKLEVNGLGNPVLDFWSFSSWDREGT